MLLHTLHEWNSMGCSKGFNRRVYNCEENSENDNTGDEYSANGCTGCGNANGLWLQVRNSKFGRNEKGTNGSSDKAQNCHKHVDI